MREVSQEEQKNYSLTYWGKPNGGVCRNRQLFPAIFVYRQLLGFRQTQLKTKFVINKNKDAKHQLKFAGSQA